MLRKFPKCLVPAQCKFGPDNNIVRKRDYHSLKPFFHNNSPPPRQYLCDNKRLKKNLAIGEMLIKQIIEFELKRPGPPGRTSTTTTGYFYDKTKISKKCL